MPHYVGLDVSQKTTAICVIDAQGKRLWRGVCATDPEPISARISKRITEAMVDRFNGKLIGLQPKAQGPG